MCKISFYNQGKLGIDDIVVHEGKCIATDLCNFESDSCGYVNNIANDLNWEVANGTYLNQTTGLSFIDVINLFILLKNVEISSSAYFQVFMIALNLNLKS